MQSFARINWSQLPKDLGLTKKAITQIKKLQVFGIQADELWSFVGKKSKKLWIWVTYDPVHRLVIAYHVGGRGKRAAKKFWNKIPKTLRSCYFETDNWEAYKSIIPSQQHKSVKI